MNPAKEFQYIIRLLNSDYVKKKRNQRGAIKKDFERVTNAPYKEYEFYKWINELILEGCLESIGFQFTSKGNKVEHFVINEDKLFERLKKNKLYPDAYKIFEDRALLGIIED